MERLVASFMINLSSIFGDTASFTLA